MGPPPAWPPTPPRSSRRCSPRPTATLPVNAPGLPWPDGNVHQIQPRPKEPGERAAGLSTQVTVPKPKPERRRGPSVRGRGLAYRSLAAAAGSLRRSEEGPGWVRGVRCWDSRRPSRTRQACGRRTGRIPPLVSRRRGRELLHAAGTPADRGHARESQSLPHPRHRPHTPRGLRRRGRPPADKNSPLSADSTCTACGGS